ncbi:uncharacterized protein LOC144580788 [Callithrix jacchus]
MGFSTFCAVCEQQACGVSAPHMGPGAGPDLLLTVAAVPCPSGWHRVHVVHISQNPSSQICEEERRWWKCRAPGSCWLGSGLCGSCRPLLVLGAGHGGAETLPATCSPSHLQASGSSLPAAASGDKPDMGPQQVSAGQEGLVEAELEEATLVQLSLCAGADSAAQRAVGGLGTSPREASSMPGPRPCLEERPLP